MDRKYEIKLILLGVAILLLITCGLIFPQSNIEKVIKAMGAGFAIIFFGYKLTTGWLILNLSIGLETKRCSVEAEDELDDLSLTVTLEKGSIDSFWLNDIDIRVSELQQNGTRVIKGYIKPYGIKKTHAFDGKVAWESDEYPNYVLSPNEKTSFSAYTRVSKRSVILLEANILGSRPFYGIESKSGDRSIQWRASTISLPK
ncbi:hypothetical protein [Chitinophaga eiseniae]|uniref:Uncharacterized protein n=1 Tax=Chitinophaga eiseniae TaxID=634771 RepID=A0A847ST20_9BACT|nr:hypothetical protein [Chitinophaga eiseniae]NLR82297.1 hypothetical protein [Chitinophaga eiseniae]